MLIKFIKCFFRSLVGCFSVSVHSSRVLLLLTAVFVMIAVLSPSFLLNPVWKAAAQTSPSIPQTAPIISAPPQAFRTADSNALFSSSFAVNVSNWQIFDLFKSEQLPEGFEAAKVSSFGEKAFTLAETSISSAFAPVFGLLANSSATTNAATLLSQPAGSVDFDFDGDGKADFARRQSATGEWKIKSSQNGNFSTAALTSSSVIVPGDFDGNGTTDAAVFSAGTWTIKNSSNGQTQTISFGQAGVKPVVGDYDGDGVDDAAIFRVSNSTWYIRQSSNLQTVSSAFG